MTKNQKIVISHVRKINPFAANWLKYILSSKKRTEEANCSFTLLLTGADIARLMCWTYTPQGHMYWNEIASKIREA